MYTCILFDKTLIFVYYLILLGRHFMTIFLPFTISLIAYFRSSDVQCVS